MMNSQAYRYNLVLGCGRLTTRLEIEGNTSRLYRGGDVVAELRHDPDGSALLLCGCVADANEALYLRDKVLRRTAFLRN